MDSGKSRPTPASGATSTRVSAGTFTPAFSAMYVAALPTISGLASRCGVTTTFATAADSASFRK
jgi:hypothetical protein